MTRSGERVFTVCVGIVIGAAIVWVIDDLIQEPDDVCADDSHAVNVVEVPPVEEMVIPTEPVNANPQNPRLEESRVALEEDVDLIPTITPISLPDIYEQHINPPQRTIRFADFHEIFKNEPRDEPWAAAMEAGLNHSIANSSSSEFIVVEYLECRSRMCEIAGYLRNEEVQPTDLLRDFERSGVWPGRYSTHTSRFSNAGGKRFVTIINGYRSDEYQSILFPQ